MKILNSDNDKRNNVVLPSFILLHLFGLLYSSHEWY